ncbi:MAG: FRG domain-containing protein [Burkholderiales bacterium]|nr:FRG domain-containing protein [Burkholderiales bacterium]
MKPSNHSTIASWRDLALLVESCANGSWIFRGEPCASYVLQPKAGRVGSYRGAARKRPYSMADERNALDLLKRQARPYLGHTPSSELEWLAIAQHHGMSTRMLDWTESLLVAAYFAVAEAGTRGDAVIYGILGLRALTSAQEQVPFALRSPGVYRPPHITPRIPAQRSVFTVHPDPTSPFSPPGLSRWVVSQSACGSIKRILDACAINESSLFPDIDGLSRYLGWRYKWAKLSTQ